MINPDMIPPEAVEAAADALMRVSHYQFRELALDDARAALSAALAAWPGGDYRPGAQVTKTWRDPGKIILPLPTEKSDD